MTKQEQKQIIRVCGEEYEETDIPTYLRNREKAEEKELAIEDLIHERDCEEDYTQDYPLSGNLEPYDIWREQELIKDK